MNLSLPDEVDLWRVSVSEAAIFRNVFQETLSNDEIEQAQRFRFDPDRERFLVAHGCLRLLLSGYLGVPASDITFSRTTHGKPFLQENSPLHFNLSHSGAWVLFAFSIQGPVGVDVEEVRPVKDSLGIARRFFSSEEFEQVRTAAEGKRDDCFFRIWTRKEAFVKAIGKGISVPLKSFSLPVSPGTVLWEGHSWWVQDLPLSENTLAAVASQNPLYQPQIRDVLEYLEG